MFNGQLPVGASMKTPNIPTTMRFSMRNLRHRNIMLICSGLILIFSVALLYQAMTSRSFVHSRRRSLPAGKDKISHPIRPVHFTDTTLQTFRQDLMFADLIARKIKNGDKMVLTDAHKNMLLDFFARLDPQNWENVAESDDVAFRLKYLLIECGLESKMSCKQIDSLISDGYVKQSESKMVERVHELVEQTEGPRKHEFVVKSVFRDNSTACATHLRHANMCSTTADYRLLREVFLLTILKHPAIIRMKGYCLRGNRVSDQLREKGMIIVTEIGITLNEYILEICTWSQKVSMALQVAKLLQYLENTPLGSLRIMKLTLSDFVLVRGTLVKLVSLDHLELGNISCTDSSDCHLEGIDMGFECVDKYCLGMNSAINLFITSRKVLRQILQKPPGPTDEALVNRLDSFNFSTRELVAELFKFFKRSPPEGPVMFNPEKTDEMTSRARHRMGHLSGEEAGGRKTETDARKAVSQFVRFEQKNFVSVYDYPCPGTIESWGCVFFVSSLGAGAKLCLTDDQCQAFVAFSSHPESENLMTVVLKNAIDTKPAVDSKTTLFVRKGKTFEKGDNKTPQDQGQGGESVPALEVQSCLDQVLLDQVSSRSVLEKSLMNHLGHKGLREEAWKEGASKHDFKSPAEMIKTVAVGGKFVFNFDNSSEDTGSTAEKVMFISEDDPHAHHKAYAILYQLDRILGLYHTPPCVGKRLSSGVVEYHRNNIVWEETFRSLISPDGTLSGILVVPPPQGLNDKVLTLEPLKTMTTEVKSFDKSNRLQLEYVLLMWLGRMERLRDNLAYKDHFIHFSADTAFASLGTDMSGYLNHCQFPSRVYEVLKCFRCHTESSSVSNKVCFLGDEVIRRTRAMFPDELNILIQSLREDDLVTSMNSAATSAVHIVDTCIDNFGRDHVLY